MSDSEWWYLDISLVVAYTGLATFALLVGIDGLVRVAIAIPLVVFLPGYVFISLAYPDTGTVTKPFDEEQTGLNDPVPAGQGLGWIERCILAVVLSVLIVPAVALVATASPWRLTFTPIVLGLSVTTMIGSILAIIARWRCAPERRFTVTEVGGLLFQPSERFGEQRHAPVFNVLLILGLVFFVGSVGYAIANPPVGEGFTEFYVETEEVTGETETMYEASYSVDDPAALTVHIENHEHGDEEYTIVVLLQALAVNSEEVSVADEEELNRTTTFVEAGGHQEQTIEFTPTMAAEEMRLHVLLYQGEPPEEISAETAYRELRLPIEIT